ncbi:MAG: hypothetical protein HYY57_01450 [Candidatus Omnitrophica bacterium]|nr:hypothetical protein [Candidatus Omnitrophota bacterium]
MSYQTSTITRTQSITHTDVRYIVWKIKSDMFQLRIYHSCFSEDYEERMAADLFLWTYRGYAEKIKFTFFDPSTYKVRHEINYEIQRSGAVGSDNDAGSIPYLDLSGITFKVLVTTNDSWRNLTETERQRFYAGLHFQWGESHLNLTYEGGSWTGDKTYSSNSIAARRTVYVQRT